MKNPTKKQMQQLIDCFYDIDTQGYDIVNSALRVYREEFGEEYPTDFGIDTHITCRNWPNCDVVGCGEW